MQAARYRIRADILNPAPNGSCRWVRDGELVFGPDGIIVRCGRRGGGDASATRIPAPRGAVTIPGLVDCHTHLSQYHVRGRTGHTLMDWLGSYVFPAEAAFRDRAFARAVANGFFRKLLANGVTTAALYANYRTGAEQALSAAAALGIRAAVGLTLMDRGVPAALRQRPEQALEDCRHLAEQARGCGNGRAWFSVNPRFAPAVSARFMEMIGRFAGSSGVYIQTHLSENPAEIALVRKLYPGIGSYAGVYDRFGLLTDRTLLAHCIHLTPAERRLVSRRRCAVVHCPSSNLFLHSGRFPIEHWSGYRKLCLGTDVGAGPSFSMLDTMRDAYFVNRQSPERLFCQATLGGAAALGLERMIGSLAPGKQADFSVVTIGERAGTSGSELLSDLIFKWDQVTFHRVFVAGREVYRA